MGTVRALEAWSGFSLVPELRHALLLAMDSQQILAYHMHVAHMGG